MYDIFNENNFGSMKIGAILDKVQPLYPETKPNKLRSKIIHLYRSHFLVAVEESYGHYKLASPELKPVDDSNSE